MVTTIIAITSLIITLVGVGVKVGTVVHAGISLGKVLDIENIDGIRGFDEVYIDLAGQAGNMLLYFIQLSTMIVYVCAFLCLVFNAFKLWAGTAEIKKIFVDTIYKCVMVMALMFVYPSVVEKVYTVGTEIGVQMAGGEKSITAAFANIAETTKGMLDKGLGPVIEIAKSGAYDVNGELTVTTDTLKELTSSSGLTQDQLIEYARANGLNVIDKNDANYKALNSALKDKNTKKDVKNSVKNNKQTLKKNKNKIKQNIAIVEALTKLFSTTDFDSIENSESNDVSVSDILNMSKETSKKIFYNPYIGDSKRLSMSTLLKTGIVIADICSEGIKGNLTDDDNKAETKVKDISNASLPLLLQLIVKFAKYFVYKIAVLISVLFLGIEYVITTIEYLIVCAVSAIMIPLFFIDATKQFATNILKMLLTYFVKIVVTTMMCFFVMTMYINSACDLVTMDLSSVIGFLYYLYIIVLGMVLAKSSGKIASAVISGNPSMGLGDVVNEFRGMSHAAHVASHHAQQAVQHAKQDAQKVADKTKNVGGEIRNNVAQRQGAKAAGSAASQNVADTVHAKGGLEGGGGEWLKSMGYDRSESGLRQAQNDASKSAKKDFMRDARKQNFSDWATKTFTGSDAYHKQNRDGSFDFNLKYGQEFSDKDGHAQKATWEDVRNAVKFKGTQSADNNVAVDKFAEGRKRKMTAAEKRLAKTRREMGQPYMGPGM